MISKQRIRDLKGKREYFEHRNDKERLRQLHLEERDAWREDLTQPSNSKFKSFYPDQHREMEKGVEERELKIKQDNQSRDEYWKRYKDTTHHEAAKKVCQTN